MSHLLLTLGHGSSAILVDDGEIKIGYETERLTHKKSDSAFPELAIMEISKWYPIEEITEIFITHWFIDPEKDLKDQGKWYDNNFMETVFPGIPIKTLGKGVTHHDAHALSVWCFNGGKMPKETHTLVIDGFGSYGETVSVYDPDSSLIFRSYGFSRSLGLFYQYATSFLDMKENQDEYKLLGYESHIDNLWSHLVVPDDVVDMAHESATRFYNRIMAGSLDVAFDPLLSLDALVATKKLFRDEFEEVLKRLRIGEEPHHNKLVRTVIAFYVQSVVEEVVLKILNTYNVINVSLAGGVFMNVKLNNAIANFLPGKTSIMPLCGDQGACIGLYHLYHGLKWPGYLTWGKRSMTNICHIPNLVVNDDAGFVIDLIERNFIVNIVRGDMEFGARALGNTSTLALPTKENVEYINKLNGRSTIMPMAPMVAEEHAAELFLDQHKVVQSLDYMICARDCVPEISNELIGVTHTLPIGEGRTCRPQIIRKSDDPYMHRIVRQIGAVINTSFNEHGKPILFREEDVERCHLFQRERDVDNRVITVVMGAYRD